VKASTANKELSRLKHLLGRAVAWSYLKTSPATKARKAKEPDGRVPFLTGEERPTSSLRSRQAPGGLCSYGYGGRTPT
jgi:hypothetical protein